MTLIVNSISLSALSDANAAEGGKISLTLMGGLSFPSITSPAFGVGFKAGYRVLPNVIANFFHYRYGVDLSASAGESYLISTSGYKATGVEGIMPFSNGFSAGMKLGLLNVAPNVTASNGTSTVTFSDSTSYLFLAPTLNYDFPFLSSFSVGGELSYLWALSSSAPKMLNILGTFKLYF